MKMKNSNSNNQNNNSSMSNMSSHEEGLRELFIEQLKDLYNAEVQLTKALPKMSKAANSEELKAAFDEHLEVTQEHVSRLERIFSDLNEKPSGKKCAAMEGLIKEGDEMIKEKQDDEIVKDAGLIAAAQRVEHYEMAGYGVVRTYAQKLGLSDAAELLQQTLDEEGEADKTLTAISENLLADQSA